MTSFRSTFSLLALLLAFPWSAHPQWSLDPYTSNPLTTAPSHQEIPAVGSDGSGGVIVAWLDYRNGNNDIYAQAIDAAGNILWTADGVPVCTNPATLGFPKITSDGSGGAIITWADQRGGDDDIFAQRIDASGNPLWDIDGIAVCSLATVTQDSPELVPDGSGGAIIIWVDQRTDAGDIFAQRISSGGSRLWADSGLAVCDTTDFQGVGVIVPDQSNGAIIAWLDARVGGLFAQRINSAGTTQWLHQGVPVRDTTGGGSYPVMIADGSGGAIIGWQDKRYSVNDDIFVQKISSSGTPMWGTSGAPLIVSAGLQNSLRLAQHGSGGTIASWIDYTRKDVYAQRVSSGGVLEWGTSGRPIFQQVGTPSHNDIRADGSGGAIIAWSDSRDLYYHALYAQKIDEDGIIQWPVDGRLVATASVGLREYVGVRGDGFGGAAMAWQDGRNGGTNNDIFATIMDKFGYLGFYPDAQPSITSITDVVGDQGGNVRILWNRSGKDIATSSGQVNVYGIWRKNPLPAATPRQALRATPAAGDAGIISEHPGILRVLDDSLGMDYDFIMTVPGVQAGSYSAVVPTLVDSSGSGSDPATFIITAHVDGDPNAYYISAADSGYSVDNLSPGSVSTLMASAEPGPLVILNWSRNTFDPDVSHYDIHRSTTDGFTPTGGTKIGSSIDTTITDSSPVVGSLNYYKIVVVDFHGNQSTPSVQASAGVGSEQLYGVQDKWNMVSVPLSVPDYSKSLLFPTATSSAFAYEGSYSAYTILANGTGYWLKFNGAQSVSMTGLPRALDTITVAEGWNMVGSIGVSISAASIISEPPGIVTSQFFGYTGAYSASSNIEPGKGYWVKASEAGALILSGSSVAPVNARIRIMPTGEMPPPPPEAFSGDLPGSYHLDQNYPNPFNPTTTIRFALPSAGNATLRVYNSLGEIVSTPIDGTVEAGDHEIGWDASGLPSGVYHLRLTAGGMTFARKMILMR